MVNWFGFRLGRIKVFLFARVEEIVRIFGNSALALTETKAILISVDSPLGRYIRHEVTHLFGAKIGPSAPTLLSEGLAVWMEYKQQLPPLSRKATALAGNWQMTQDLINTKKFYDMVNRDSYQLAAHLTDNLIQRFGWDAYIHFYRVARESSFRKVFKRLFGISFESFLAESIEKKPINWSIHATGLYGRNGRNGRPL